MTDSNEPIHVQRQVTSRRRSLDSMSPLRRLTRSGTYPSGSPVSPHLPLSRIHLDTVRPMLSASSALAQIYPSVVDQTLEERMELNHDLFFANESARTSRGVLRRRVLAGTHHPSISSVQQHTEFVDVSAGGHSMPDPAPVTQLHQNSKMMLRARMMSPEEDDDIDESPEVSTAAAVGVVEDELESPGSVVVLNRLSDLEKRQARIEVLLEQIVSKL